MVISDEALRKRYRALEAREDDEGGEPYGFVTIMSFLVIVLTVAVWLVSMLLTSAGRDRTFSVWDETRELFGLSVLVETKDIEKWEVNGEITYNEIMQLKANNFKYLIREKRNADHHESQDQYSRGMAGEQRNDHPADGERSCRGGIQP